MEHILKADERERALLKRFHRFPVPAIALESFLGQHLFRPSEVRDYGEVPSYYRYFEEADTTVELYIEPILNAHYSDDTPRRIEWVAFRNTNFIHGTAYRLCEVNPALMEFVLRSLTRLIRQSSEYLYNGPPDADVQLILAHGAGEAMDSELLTCIAERVAVHGIRVVRFEFPYMQRWRQDGRQRAPNSVNVLRESWLRVLEAHGGGRRNFIGGRSLGGRIAAQIAIQSEARGLVCLDYPFHPRGKPQALRLKDLQEMTIPTLVLQGSRDVFGNREEVIQYPLSPQVNLVWLEGGDHAFRLSRGSDKIQLGHWEVAVETLVSFLVALSQDAGGAYQ
ncbi:MAG: hypothetical protein JW900_03925 [Anaerolineae bacterium]|nr:hypothetical protein [Anaerolineae bacterium]